MRRPSSARIAACLALVLVFPSCPRAQAAAEVGQGEASAEAPKPPPGLLDEGIVRDHRPLAILILGAGATGGLAMTAFGIYGLARDIPDGLGSSSAQRDILDAACGFVLCSLFSFCLGVELAPPPR